MKKILLASALCSSILFAEVTSDKYNYELTPFGAGILTNSKSTLEDDNYFNAGLAFARNLQNSFLNQIELSYLRSASLGYKDGKDTNINRFFINGIKNFPLTQKLSAYGLAGLGYQDVTQELNDKLEDSAILNYGLGLRYDISYYGIAVKSDIRHLFSIENSNNNFMYTLGLAMPFGYKAKEEVNAVVPNVIETKKEVFEEEPIVENDDDKDGISNDIDKCPNTTQGVKVNADGCVETVNLDINFDYKSTQVKDEYKSIVENFAKILQDNPSFNATIQAHTDSIGSNEYNQELSQRRANSVINALKNLNINSSRLTAIGYGETQPIATNETKEGRAQNRRVVGLINQ